MIDAFFNGTSFDAYQLFGAHISKDKQGVDFTVYAPHAKNVQVAGDFNGWDGNWNWLTKIDDRGIWHVHVLEAKEYHLYKYRIETNDGWVEKADPYATYSELRPNWASIIVDTNNFKWTDSKWLKKRSKCFEEPLNIYEVHFGGWKRNEFEQWYTYKQLEIELIPYVLENGYTHIEIMPIFAYPFDGSWGYQIFGFYSLTSRYGTAHDFQHFVDTCHKNGIGVIIDFVPVHFASDGYGLVKFDGSEVYEYPKDYDANSEWGTFNFDLGKDTVRSFMMSCTKYWVERYHIDGIRVDAVSNLIYWQGNKNRGTNEGALEFVRRLNNGLEQQYPTVMKIAEDSSDYPNVTVPVNDGGLGFDYKWDLGWMNDTLKYYKRDVGYRKHHHNDITFSMAYYHSERFLLPFSHDEVVHGKLTILNKMWGDYDQKFAQCKNLFTYMMTHPGKKLNFMGNEIGHFREFDDQKQLDWFLLKYPRHKAFARAIKDLMLIYKGHDSLYKYDYAQNGFKWIDPDNNEQSVFSYYRESDKECLVVILNMNLNSYEEFTVGVPYSGKYIEIFNSEKDIYEGCNMCNFKPISSKKERFKEFENTITCRIAPLSGIILLHTKRKTTKSGG